MSESRVEGKRKAGRKKEFSESAQKKRRKDLFKERSKQKVYVGEHLDRWNALREELKLTHHGLAGVLLDRYYAEASANPTIMPEPKTGKPEDVSSRQFSTPMDLGKGIVLTLPEPTVSEISSAESEMSSKVMSGVEELAPERPSSSRRTEGKRISHPKEMASFIDPFNLTINVSEDFTEHEDLDDPTFNITLGADDMQDIEDKAAADIIFGYNDAAEGEDSETDDDVTEVEGPEISKLKEENLDAFLDDHCAIVFVSQLERLANIKVDGKCLIKGCKETVQTTIDYIGSAVYVTWVCSNGHQKQKWCSQPVMNRRLHSGDLSISAAILLSGNNFAKMKLFADFMGLKFPNCDKFNRIQRTYLIPSIEKTWTTQQSDILDEMRDEEIVVLGDGRMDSPGHCAQYCTYTLMENTTKKIVSVSTLDKRQTAKKSTNMEKAGMIQGLEELRGKGMRIGELVTDAHLQIGAVMKRQYADIKHSHDIWHAAKNLGKKIIAAGQDKESKDLLKWTKDITNHFWHTCKEANTYEEFLTIWAGVLHHVVDEHEWALSYGTMDFGQCSHGALDDARNKPWLEKGTKAHEALRRIVLDKRLLNNVHYFLNFRSTAELENFHTHILMYAAKRFSYTPPVYRARSLLAAIDYNAHVNRPAAVTKEGRKRYHRTFNKKSERWSAVEVKVKKTYSYIRDLLRHIFILRLGDRIGMSRKSELSQDDPRRISSHFRPCCSEGVKILETKTTVNLSRII